MRSTDYPARSLQTCQHCTLEKLISTCSISTALDTGIPVFLVGLMPRDLLSQSGRGGFGHDAGHDGEAEVNRE